LNGTNSRPGVVISVQFSCASGKPRIVEIRCAAAILSTAMDDVNAELLTAAISRNLSEKI
jgi:hypothetical protein